MLSSGRGWFLPLRPVALWAVVGSLGLGGCADGASGPGDTGAGYIALQPALPADIRDGEFSLGINAVGLRLQRPGARDLVVDTVLAFHPDSAALHAAIRVGMLRRVEEFSAELTLLDGDLVLFTGSKLVLLQQGPPGTNAVDSIPVSYQGPGRDIASIEIQPRDTTLPFGDSLPLRVLALDSGGLVVTRFFVSWTASDTTPGRVNAFGLVRAPELRGSVTVSARTPNGASASAQVGFIPGPPYDLLVQGHDSVDAPVGSAVSLVVRVVAGDGLGVQGIPVHFRAATAGGSVTDSLVVSDAGGIAATQVRAGETVRNYEYEARIGTSSPSRFMVAATAGPPAALGIEGGDGQAGQVGQELAQPVAVRVRDAHGNPVRGQRVNFVVTSGGGSVWAGSNNTNDSGVAMERWTLGRSTAVPQRLEARAVDNSTGAPLLFAVFRASAVPGPAASLVQVGGDGQVGTVGTALAESLAVRLSDAFGNGVEGVSVSWLTESGGTVSPGGPTGADGTARAAWQLGPLAGTQRARTVLGDRSAEFEAVAVAGPPATATVSAPATLLSAVGAEVSLEVVVRDEFGNLVTGATVVWSSSNPAVAEVDAAGRVTARGNGTARVTATVGSSVAGYVDLTVAQAVAELGLVAASESLTAFGETVQLEAVARDANGHAVSGAGIVWSSSNPDVASVDAAGLVTAHGNGEVTITAMVEAGASASLLLTVAQTIVAAQVTPEQATLAGVGASVQLELTALDRNGYPVDPASVTWSSSDPDVATVSSGGLVTAVGPGDVTVSATVTGGVVQTVTLSVAVSVSVAPSVASVLVTPGAATLTALGQSVMLAGTPVDGGGSPIAGMAVAWQSSNEAVATVSSAGLVAAVGNGTAMITATSGGVSGTATVTVAQVVTSVTVSPSSATLTALGASVQLAASLTDANGHAVSAAVTWASSSEGVATVSGTGLVAAVGNGTVTITATSGGISGTATVTVAAAPTTLTVVIVAGSGSSKTINLGSQGTTPVAILTTSTDAGEPVTFDAQAVDVPTVRLVGVAPASSSLEDVDGDGDVDLRLHFTTTSLDLSLGNTTITVTGFTTGGTAIEGHDEVVVIGASPPPALPPPPPRVGSVEVTPASATLAAIGATVQLAATVQSTDANVLDGAEVTWSSSNPGVASVDATGLVAAVMNGTATITATSDGVSGTALVTVSQVPAAVAVSPASLSFSALAATAQLSATVQDANGHAIPGVDVTWLSSNPEVVQVSASGLVTALGNGSATITARDGEASAYASVAVAQVVSSVIVSPSSITLVGIGATGDLEATARDANGNAIAAALTWSSANPDVARVDGSGLVTAVSAGTTAVQATADGVSGGASVTVEVPEPPAPETPLAVVIAVKPGATEEVKPINLTSDGVTPVALLTTAAGAGEAATFDAASVVISSVTFAGAPAVRSALEDVDRDGDLDRIFQFDTRQLQLTPSSTNATLRGRTTGDRAVQGSAPIQVIK